MPWLFFFSALAIPAFYAVGMLARTDTHLSVAEFWRFWVVHLWVEDFLELFTTVMVAYIFVMLGVVREKIALGVIFLDIILYSAGGVIGTMHHLYFSGTPVEHMALGAAFSAAEVIPLTFLTVEAWSFLQLGSRQESRSSAPFPHRWAVMFLVAVGFWNFLGAGIFGFLINLPIVSYYEIGTALTANHAHAAMMGVYGMLAVGLAMFALRYLIPADKWPDKLARLSFWSLNIGLAWMVFATLLPLGVLQLYHSVGTGYFEARSTGLPHHPGQPAPGMGPPARRRRVHRRRLPALPLDRLAGRQTPSQRQDRPRTARGRAVHRARAGRVPGQGDEPALRAPSCWWWRMPCSCWASPTDSTAGAPHLDEVRAMAHRRVHLPRGPRRLAVPPGPVAVAALLRSRPAGHALPRQPSVCNACPVKHSCTASPVRSRDHPRRSIRGRTPRQAASTAASPAASPPRRRAAGRDAPRRLQDVRRSCSWSRRSAPPRRPLSRWPVTCGVPPPAFPSHVPHISAGAAPEPA